MAETVSVSYVGPAEVLNGRDFVAVVRLSTGSDQTLAMPGETCERVQPPAGKGTASDALRLLLACGYIRRQDAPATPAVQVSKPAPIAPAAAAKPVPPAAKEGE
jgi:hypothetical protein